MDGVLAYGRSLPKWMDGGGSGSVDGSGGGIHVVRHYWVFGFDGVLVCCQGVVAMGMRDASSTSASDVHANMIHVLCA